MSALPEHFGDVNEMVPTAGAPRSMPMRSTSTCAW